MIASSTNIFLVPNFLMRAWQRHTIKFSHFTTCLYHQLHAFYIFCGIYQIPGKQRYPTFRQLSTLLQGLPSSSTAVPRVSEFMVKIQFCRVAHSFRRRGKIEGGLQALWRKDADTRFTECLLKHIMATSAPTPQETFCFKSANKTTSVICKSRHIPEGEFFVSHVIHCSNL